MRTDSDDLYAVGIPLARVPLATCSFQRSRSTPNHEVLERVQFAPVALLRAPHGPGVDISATTSVLASCVFELRPYAREGSDVVVIERIDEVLLDRLLEAPLGRFSEVSSALGEADERHPSVALVGATLEMPGVDEVLDQP